MRRQMLLALVLVFVFTLPANAEKKEFGDKKSIKHERHGEQPDNSYIVEAECQNCKKVFPIWIKKGTKLTDSILKSEIECPKCGCFLGPMVDKEGDYE